MKNLRNVPALATAQAKTRAETNELANLTMSKEESVQISDVIKGREVGMDKERMNDERRKGRKWK